MLSNRVRLVLFFSAILAAIPSLATLRVHASQTSSAHDIAVEPTRDWTGDIPAHIWFVEGQVTLERAGKLEPVETNLPLLAGDRLHTRGGRVEILYADGSTIDVDQDTELDLLSDALVRLVGGTMRVTIPHAPADLNFRIDAPAAYVEVRAAGEFRVDTGVDQHGAPDVALTAVHGSADLVNNLGRTAVRAGHQAVATATEAPSDAFTLNLANMDEFDQWSDARRTERVASDSAAYVPEAVQPYSSVLDAYGTWTTEPAYGAVWYPRVGADWHPYSQGRWSYSGYYGWLWVGIDHWAWPTHHFGRWGIANDQRWFWIPGQSWAPAWVSWAYAPGYVGWCPLGFNNHSVIGFTAIGTQTVSAFRVFDPLSAWSVMPANNFVPNVWVTQNVVARGNLPAPVRNAMVERPVAPAGPELAVARNATPPLRALTHGSQSKVITGPFDAARVQGRSADSASQAPIRSRIIGTPPRAPAVDARAVDRGHAVSPVAGDPLASSGERPAFSANDPSRASSKIIEVPRADLNNTAPARAIPRPSDPRPADPFSYPTSRSSDTAPRVIPRLTDPAPGFEPPSRGRAVDRTSQPTGMAPPPSAPSAPPSSRGHASEAPAGRATPAAPPSAAPPSAAPAPSRGGGSGSGSSGRGATSSGTASNPGQAVSRGGGRGGGGA